VVFSLPLFFSFFLCFKYEQVNVHTEFYFFLPAAAGAAPGFGRFAPYFDLRCVLPATPDVSSAPRTM
jgi:hypothetical protein